MIKAYPKGWPEGKKSLFDLTVEEMAEVRRQNPPEITATFAAEMYMHWHWAGCGFGELSIKYDPAKRIIECENECMSRESVRSLLHSFADYIADRAVLIDNPEDKPPVDFEAELKRQDDEIY